MSGVKDNAKKLVDGVVYILAAAVISSLLTTDEMAIAPTATCVRDTGDHLWYNFL
jgi:hypothetical protein